MPWLFFAFEKNGVNVFYCWTMPSIVFHEHWSENVHTSVCCGEACVCVQAVVLQQCVPVPCSVGTGGPGWVAVTASLVPACPISHCIGCSSDADSPPPSLPPFLHPSLPRSLFSSFFFSLTGLDGFLIHVLSAVPPTATFTSARLCLFSFSPFFSFYLFLFHSPISASQLPLKGGAQIFLSLILHQQTQQ